MKAESGISKMMRQPSHSSSLSGSTSNASPKGRLSFFKKSKSRDESGSSDKIYEAPPSDKIPTSSSPFSLPDLEMTRPNGNLPSPDSFIGASHDTEYLHLRENIRRLRKAPSGPDPKKVDATWEVYKKLREESLQLCKSLLQKSQNSGRNASLESSNIGPLDTRSSFSGSVAENALPDQWLTAIHEYKGLQEGMLENLRTSLLATFRAYESDAPERQLESFLADKLFRKNLIIKWRDTSVHRMKSEKLLFWEQYKIRSLNFDKLKLDLQAIEHLFDVADSSEAQNMAIREYVIARNGDTVLEFANAASEIHRVLRFRVSSHVLAEASSLFSQILSPRQPGMEAPLDMIADLPPAPRLDTCKDGMEVKVYRMPQIELNENESLTILLHAAHMHKEKVPREIDFPAFVSIADVCVRYRCTSPIELQVEYQWLPQWVHAAGDEYNDGLLLIAYAFGDQAMFKRTSKIAILSAVDEAEIESKIHWPLALREKIKGVRAAKLAQIHACCANAIEEYFRPPLDNTNRRTSVGSLTLTTVPRCPRGSHLCDATNLGWLMLVYNELRVLPSIMNNAGFHLPKSPQRCLKELVDCLRQTPSAPQVHSGVCDYAPAFRSAINDIYNSVSGLTLREVSGRTGWALSKDADPNEDTYDELSREVHELSAIESPQERDGSLPMSSHEAVCFRMLSHLDDIKDLNSAAMIDKGWYGVYKRNEAALLKNVMRAERRRTLSMANPEIARFRESARGQDPPPRLIISPQLSEDPKYLASDNIQDQRHNDLYDVSPPLSPMSQEEVSMSAEEAHKILWPDDIMKDARPDPPQKGHPVERNEKYLVGDVSHIEDKTMVEEDNKHLRDEKDMALGLGIRKSKPKPS